MAAFDLENYETQLRKDSLAELQTVLQDFLQKHGQAHHHLVQTYLYILQQLKAKPEDFLKRAPRIMADIKLTQDAFGNPFLAVMFRCVKKLSKLASFKTIMALEDRELADFKACLVKAATDTDKMGVEPGLLLKLNQQLLEMNFTRKQLLAPHHGTFEKLPMGSCYRMLAKLCQVRTWTNSDVQVILELLSKMQEVTRTYLQERKQQKERMRSRVAGLIRDPVLRAIMGLDDTPSVPAPPVPEQQHEDQQEEQPEEFKKEEKTSCC